MSLGAMCRTVIRYAVITPVLKKTKFDPNALENYRPILNLPFLAKDLDHLQHNLIFETFQSGFKPHHSTQTALVKVSSDLLLASDEGLVSLLVLLDLSTAFDMINYNILLQRLEHVVKIKGTAVSWFKSCLSDRYQFAQENQRSVSCSAMSYGVPQGSVLGPILFTLYMLPLGIIRNHGGKFHCYADDTQLYLSNEPNQTDQIDRLRLCISDTRTWTTKNYLLLNPHKTEVIISGPQRLRDPLSEQTLTLDSISISSTPIVKNLGVLFDQDLSFNSHIKQTCKTAYFHLRNIAKIRNILSKSDAEKRIHAFVSSRLDYCNSLLAGCP